MGRILLYADEYVAGWMAERMGETIIPPYTSFATVSADGHLTGAVLFNGLNEGNVEVSIYAPRHVSRALLRTAASYAFGDLQCNRVSARTRASSLKVRRFIEKAGFREEGVLRSYYRDGDDAILFGMTKAECRW